MLISNLEKWHQACINAGLNCTEIEAPKGPFPGGVADEYMEEVAGKATICNVRILGNNSYPQVDEYCNPRTDSELTVSAVVAGNLTGQKLPGLGHLDPNEYHMRGSFTVWTEGSYDEMETLVRQCVPISDD